MYSAKPRSMTAGARNVLRSNDSASLWNCTLSPGWTDEESETLRKALMKFGVGNWAKIIESNCLPGKTNAQMNLQLQRLLGQQSTAEFAGLHIDPKIIGAKNAKIQGPHIKRKNNCIVNTGGKLSREELKRRVISNKEEYELPESDWKDIVLPKVADPVVTLELKKDDLKRLKLELEKVQECIIKIKSAHPTRIDKLKSTLLSTLNSPKTPGTPGTPGTPNTPTPGTPLPSTPTPEPIEPVDMAKPMEEDQDLLLAIRLQKEEDAKGIFDFDIDDEEEEEYDDDFSHAKKRKVTSKRKVTRK